MIAVLDYGIGNLRSAQKALQQVGGDARLIAEPAQAVNVTAVVLPGVGSFGACMEALRTSGLDRVAIQAIESGIPFLGICVGMQMLYKSSEESPGVSGLGIVDARVVKLSGDAKLPQMQWNKVTLKSTSQLLEPGSQDWFYFVHSYGAELTDEVVATCDYGGDVVAMIERGNLWATQFHPEKSSVSGLNLLRKFVELTA